jgi:hypothetical protein
MLLISNVQSIPSYIYIQSGIFKEGFNKLEMPHGIAVGSENLDFNSPVQPK